MSCAGTAGSKRCTLAELQEILASVGDFQSKAGGSASNVGRALASGFSTPVQVVGTRGPDEWGAMYSSAMRRAGVDTERMRVLPEGFTGRSAILTCDGERTMRTFLDPKVSTRVEDLSVDDFSGCSFVFLSSYCLYSEGLLQRAVQLAREVGAKVVLDLASYEVVRSYHKQLMEVLGGGGIHFCICNEDEAQMLLRCAEAAAAATPAAGGAVADDAVAAAGYPPDSSLPAAVLGLLLRHCEGAVVTRGVLGCVAGRRGGEGLVAVPAVPGVAVVDTTGAGDHFTAGFVYGLLSGQSLERCCQVACLAGAAAVRVVGAELSPNDWQWFHTRLHGDLAGDVVQDSSAAEVAQVAAVVAVELLGCYALIGRLGRGAVYFGSARLAQGSPYWSRAVRLAERVSQLLGSPVWTGGGPGMMRAASEGGLRAGVPVGGIRISREAGTNVLTMEDYLPAGAAFTCTYMPTRKVALTDAGARQSPEQRTAYLFLPGGLGTMDELFSILTLLQLGKLGSALPVPLLVLNWDGFYDGLMALLQAFDESGALRASEVREVMVARTNDEVLEYLARFYDLPVPDPEPDPIDGDGDGNGESPLDSAEEPAAAAATDGDASDVGDRLRHLSTDGAGPSPSPPLTAVAVAAADVGRAASGSGSRASGRASGAATPRSAGAHAVSAEEVLHRLAPRK
ncbi:hypothetical protein GPECTOR_3g330 [Gonium pectorale]|uniref:Carbohydrate kinase PfkB domain-containing protein n=1 Tax=Gonium pectorale TaxID=33097 RepID=A0A150GZE4_GONPE|nr:hypothetical protein GPECTOR_3g330 [Gonium pectorale]|eukprot:KXZ55185.1 hypothetical protein GPECTOR_3g330 [Gonium pectorale]